MKRHQFWILICVAIGAVLWLVTASTSLSSSKTKPSYSVEDVTTFWPLIVPERIMNLTGQATIPQLEKGAGPSEVLLQLLSMCPNKEAQVLRNGLIDGDVIASPSVMQNNAAAQMLAVKGRQLSLPELIQSQYYPVLTLNMKYVRAAIDSMEGQTELLFYLCHESVHYQQMLNHDGDLASWAEQLDSEMTFQNCTQNWLREEEAYITHCLSGYQLGYPQSTPVFCEVVADRQAFNQRIFYIRVVAEQETFPECLYAWAVQAGHPDPERFK